MSFFQKLFKPKAKRLSEPAGTPATAPIVSQAVSPPPRPATPAPAVAVVALAPVPSPVPPTQPAAAHRANRWQNVYVFISSTFNDMHAERDYLVKQVFPQLQEWCERRKLRLVDIDLRWGVTEQDATENKRVVQVCLERIDACRPFFFCFLGQRRGWVPGEGDISAQTYENYPALKQKNYVGTTSVTEMEILHALVDPLHQGHPIPPGATAEHYERVKYAFFYLRQPEYLNDLPTDPPQLRQVYTNEAIADAAQRAEADSQLQLWRETTIPSTGRPAHPYMAHWGAGESTPEIRLPLTCPSTAARDSQARQAAHAKWARQWAQAGVQVDENGEISDPVERAKAEAFNSHLIQGRLADFTCRDHPLAETIIADLQAAIHERYPEHVEVASASLLQRELDQQEQALRLASEGFIERAGDFAALDDYVNGPSDRLFVLTAQGGLGKTSLLAKWIDRTALNLAGGESLHYRFIGASDGSTTVDVLLRSVLREIQEIGRKFSEEIPSDPNKMRMELPKLLEAAGMQGKTVIVLDGLNQLESKLSDLAWLPLALPANVKLVVSFKRGEAQAESYFEQLQARANVILAEVKPFESLSDRRQLVQVYLSQFLKELDERHVETLILSEGAGNPLYLKVVLSELRVFGAFADLGEKIRAYFGTTPVSAFQGVLNRLENDPAYSLVPPELLVPRVFGWLAHARQGLSVEELSGLLVQEGLLPDDATGRQKVEEAVHGLLRQVRPYLARRDGQVDFFYESFKLAAVGRYVREEDQGKAHPQARPAREWHAALAGYFEHQPGALPASANRRRLYELPYQQTYAALWPELAHTLTDFDFLEAKCAAFSVYDLEEDYLLALRSWGGDARPKNILAAFGRRLSLEAGQIHLSPEILFAQLYNRLTWPDAPYGPVHRQCEEAGRNRKDWLRVLQDPGKRLLNSSYSKAMRRPGEQTAMVMTPDGRRVVSGAKVWDLASGHLLCSLEGFWTGDLPAVAVTADGRQIVAPTGDNILNVCDLEGGWLVRSLEGHTDRVNAVAATPDGRMVVSGSSDRTLKVWDLASGRLLRSLEGHTDSVKTVAVSPDGRQIVSGSDDKTLKVWDLASGCVLRSLEGHTEAVTAVAVTPDGCQAVSGAGSPWCYRNSDCSLKVWELASGRLLRTLDGHTDRVSSVAVTPNGRQVVSGSYDHTLKVWDLESGRLVRSLEGHTNAVTAVAVTPDGRQVVSMALDRTLRVWGLSTGSLVRSLEGHTDGVTAVAVTPDGRQVVSGSSDHHLKVWELASGDLLRSLEGHTDGVRFVTITPDGRQVVSGSRDHTLKVWDLASGGLLHTLEGHTEFVNAVAVTPDGQQIVSGSSDYTLKVWELESGHLLRTLEGHNDAVNALAVAPDGRQVVSGSADKTIKVWDLASGRLLRSLEGDTFRVSDVAVTPDGRQIVSGGYKTIKVWELASGRLLHTLEGSTECINVVAVTPDGQQIVSGAPDGGPKVWDLASGHLLGSPAGYVHGVRDLAVTPDGRQVVYTSGDTTLTLCDLACERSSRRSLEGHAGVVNAVAVTPDGRQVVSASGDKTIKVWDLVSGRLLHSLAGHTQAVDAVAVTSDGRQVVSASNDWATKVWDLASGNLLCSLENPPPDDYNSSLHYSSYFSSDYANVVAVTLDMQQIISGLCYKWDNNLKGVLRVRDLASGRLLRSLEGHTDAVNAVAVTPDGQQVASGSRDTTIGVWNLDSGRLLRSLEGHTWWVNSVALTPDGRQVVSGSADRTLKVWDLESGRLLRSMEGHTDEVLTIAITPDGRQVVSGSKDKTIRLWNLRENTTQVLFRNDAPIPCLALTRDGHYLCCGDGAGRVWIFEWVGMDPNA